MIAFASSLRPASGEPRSMLVLVIGGDSSSELPVQRGHCRDVDQMGYVLRQCRAPRDDMPAERTLLSEADKSQDVGTTPENSIDGSGECESVSCCMPRTSVRLTQKGVTSVAVATQKLALVRLRFLIEPVTMVVLHICQIAEIIVANTQQEHSETSKELTVRGHCNEQLGADRQELTSSFEQDAQKRASCSKEDVNVITCAPRSMSRSLMCNVNSGDCLMPPPLPNQPTAHPLTHLTNTTQNLTGLVHAQMKDIKVQTELMRKWEERDKAPASMLVRQGFAIVFAVSRPDAAAAACKVCDWYKPDSQQIM
ncbi:hypothetical protein BC835DRAFT_1311326 [Cytidiella melzeri]|nr:hypothetical protein BC835DRAFT_1311326 [Cytidiella melzeri]